MDRYRQGIGSVIRGTRHRTYRTLGKALPIRLPDGRSVPGRGFRVWPQGAAGPIGSSDG
jgi:hypothetical protein